MTATYFEIPAQAVFPGGLALVALAITLILLLVYRRYPKRHLLLWIGATAALTALHGFVVLGTVSRGLAERALIEQLPIALAVLAAWLRGGLIAAGAYELTRRRTVHLRRLTVLGPLWGIALLTAVLIPAFGGTRSLALVTVAGALLAAVGFTIAGWLLVSRRGEQRGVATLLFGILFLFYGAAALVHAGVVSAAAVHGLPAPFPRETALLEILFQIVIGLGMMSLILEDERDAAVLAASQVEHIAYHDSLTGLPNRSRFMDRLTDALERARRHRYKLAVLFLDLDRFKQINDSLGHTMGDLLLKAVAGRLRGALRQDDMVARFGGDEFAVLIHIIGRIDDAAGVAQKVLDVLEPPIPLGDREIVMATSIGITIFPTDGVDGEALVKNADTAMYRAKAHGGSTFQ
ncbi:MAG TPA: GGDEF domain-containing protein, partial [Thermoanaerobaculia bacterium]|nr:GGDEF domain-containing protein [Thermoanaerobaculia bacterium]